MKKLYEESNIQAIANAIRQKSGSSETMLVSEMASAIENIPSGGGVVKMLDRTLKKTKCEFYSDGELVITPLTDTINLITSNGSTTAANLGENIIVPLYGVIKTITVKGNATKIEAYSFTEEKANSEAYIASTLTAGATLPTTINFENDSITTLGMGNFYFNPYLVTLDLKMVDTISGENTFRSMANLTTLTLGQVETIPNYTFRESNKLSSLSFYGTSSAPVKSIGNNAFYYCEKLSDTSFISPLATFIGSYAFSYSGIESITIPEGVSFSGSDTFSHCASLESVVFSPRTPSSSDSLTIPQNFCLGDTALAEVVLPDYTEAGGLKLNSACFSGCTSLTENGIDFTKITGLANANVSSSFANCTSLVNVNLSNFEGFTSTGTGQSNMFNGCTNLETVSFGKTTSNTEMKFQAPNTFNNCKKLTKVTFNQPVSLIHNNFFQNATSDSAGTGLTIEFKQNTTAEVQALANYPWRMTNATFVCSDT